MDDLLFLTPFLSPVYLFFLLHLLPCTLIAPPLTAALLGIVSTLIHQPTKPITQQHRILCPPTAELSIILLYSYPHNP